MRYMVVRGGWISTIRSKMIWVLEGNEPVTGGGVDTDALVRVGDDDGEGVLLPYLVIMASAWNNVVDDTV